MSRESKHTPWLVLFDEGRSGRIYADASAAQAAARTIGSGVEVMPAAHARAAPDLLAALREMVPHAESHAMHMERAGRDKRRGDREDCAEAAEWLRKECKRVRALIAKAEGAPDE